jgi:dTDP-4-dehydrorhamnose 3,5-epimerase
MSQEDHSSHLIEGVRLRKLGKNSDKRGYFFEMLRDDWHEFLAGDRPVQFSLSVSKPGVVRAWHRHARGQNDYIICIDGSIRVGVFDDRRGSRTRDELDEFVLSGDRPQVVRVVGSCWHGYRVLGNTPATVTYAVTKLYNHARPDEERRLWKDPQVIPKAINGSKRDARVGRPYEWLS